MLALDPDVVEAAWQAFHGHLPEREEPPHPLGCHRGRISDRDCFEAILFRLVTGCSWDVAGRLGRGSETTLRRRRDEWVAAGVFDLLANEALAAYDRIIGLDLNDVSMDASAQKAPCGGEDTGPSPTDRGKTGWKWSLAADAAGIPLGWVAAGANRQDCILVAATLDTIATRGLLSEIATIHLDRGYDNGMVRTACVARGIGEVVVTKRRAPGKGRYRKRVPLGLRWPVERTNSWLSNFGQLRRNTDRFSVHRLAQLALAVALILTIKLVKRARRWSA